jgi:hypothetical protein
VNEATPNDADYFYYENTANATYAAVKFNVDLSKIGFQFDSLRVLYRTATTAASTKTLQCRWDTTGTLAGSVIFDTTTADADSVYATDVSHKIAGLRRGGLGNFEAGVFGITATGSGTYMRVTWIAIQVFSHHEGAQRLDFDTSDVYDAQYWELMAMQAKFRPLTTVGSADSGAVTILFQMSNDQLYWTTLDSMVVVDSLAAFKVFTMQPYRYSRFITHNGVKSDSAGVRGGIVVNTSGRW